MEESNKKRESSRKRRNKKGKGKKRTKGGDTVTTENKKRKFEGTQISQKSRYSQRDYRHWVNRTVVVMSCKDEDGIEAETINMCCTRPKMNSTESKVPSRVRKFWAMRHIVGSCIEGIAEYCRIAYDLLSEDVLISVISVGTTINRINNWHEDQQQISQILSRFSGTKSVQKTNIKKGLEMAVKCLVEPLPQRHSYEPSLEGQEPFTANAGPILNRTRIICIFQDQQEGKNMNDSVYSAYQTGSGTLHLLETISNLIEKENAHITSLNMNTSATSGECGQTIDHCDIVFITIVPAKYLNVLPPSNSMRHSDKITIETNFITPALVKDTFIDLAVSHFNLAALHITHIPIQGKKTAKPLKSDQGSETVLSPLQANEELGGDSDEENTEEKEGQYDVELLYHNADSIMVLQTLTHHGHVLGNSFFWRNSSRMIDAKWCPIPLKLDTDTLPSLSVHRITPHARTALPTLTLIKWIFQGNPVLLTCSNLPENILDKGSTKDSESESPQYMLMVHGGNIYLHKLYDDQLDLSLVVPPGFNEKEDRCFCIYDTNNNIPKTLEGLRQQDFLDMTRENQLSYCDPSQAQRMRTLLKYSGQALLKGGGTVSPGGAAPGGVFSYMSTTCLDRLTRVFPLRTHDTVFFDVGTHTEKMQEILRPLQMLLVKEELQGTDLKGALECISRLHQNAKSNSALLFPSDVSTDIRQQRYVRLWQEIRTLAEKQQKNSKNHKKILSNIDVLWPEMVQQLPEGSSNAPSTTVTGATATTTSVTGTTGTNVSGTEEDPNQYRLIPQHAQGREETGEEIKNDMNMDTGVLRPDLLGLEQPYAAKRHAEDLLPSLLETKDPFSLYYKYWKNAEVKQESFIFDGYK